MSVPSVADLRMAADAAIAHGAPGAVALALSELWHHHAGPSQAGYVLAHAGRLRPAVTQTVAIARSFTVEPIVPILRAAARLRNLDLSVTVGGFNTYAQEILDPRSALYGADAPASLVILTHTRDVAPELWEVGRTAGGESVERVLDHLVSLVTTVRDRSDMSILVANLEQPPWPTLGTADGVDAGGQLAAIRAINAGLADRLGPVPGCFVADLDGAAGRVGRERWSDDQRWEMLRLPYSTSALVPLADELLRLLHPMFGNTAKVLAVDLDNTLWGGVVGEDGVAGLRLDPARGGAPFLQLQRALLALKQRGVLLAVCSKNNEAEAMAGLAASRMLIGPDDFAAHRMNWADKATNLRSIAAELDVGIDSVAFLDDNPAERSLVAELVPEVAVIAVSDDPATYARAVLGEPRFERPSLSAEDRRRTELYRDTAARTALRSSSSDLASYLTALETVTSVSPAGAPDIARLAQLTAKTNQLNLTTRRHSEAAIASMAADPAWAVYAVRARDRFGDHGTVGLMIVDRSAPEWRIDTFLLSCRVIGRDIERAMAAVAVTDALAGGADAIIGDYLPTAKNAPAAEVYERAGFERQSDGEHGSRWRRDLSRGPIELPPWITLSHPGAPHD